MRSQPPLLLQLLFLQIFAIHPLIIDDIWGLEQREKCELYEDYTFICVRALSGKSDHTAVIYILCSERFVITFHNDLLDTVFSIQTRLDRLAHITLTAGWITYGILDHVVDGLMPAAMLTEVEVKTIEDLTMLISQDSQNEILM